MRQHFLARLQPVLLVVLYLVSSGGVLPAQQTNPGQYSIPRWEAIERPTVTDENGLLQWAEMDSLTREELLRFRCPTCEGRGKQECAFCWRMERHEECPECHTGPDDKKHEAVCRTCAGEAVIPDMLLKAPCPGCNGAGINRCHRCFGEGGYPTAEGSDRLAKCPVCKGSGHFECNCCDGEKLVDPVKLKPSVGEADLDDLNDAKVAANEVLAGLEAVVSTGDGRKDTKLWKKPLRAGLKLFPVLRDFQKDVEKNTKDMAKGSNAVAYAKMVQSLTEERKQTLTFYLNHQIHLLDQCIKRQEHNAKVGGKD